MYVLERSNGTILIIIITSLRPCTLQDPLKKSGRRFHFRNVIGMWHVAGPRRRGPTHSLLKLR